MLGFEMFDVGSWLENGLTKQVPRPEHEKSATVRRSGKWIVTAAIFSAAVAVSAPSFSTVPGSSLVASVLDGVGAALAPSLGEVKEGYWPTLMAEIDTWKPVQVAEVDCPVDVFI